MDLRLDGKVALVTGGSRGIGKAIAGALAASGARVMITSRKEEALREAAAELPGEIEWFAANVGRAEDAEACVAATMERLGRLDILVNNAATNPYYGAMIDIDQSRADKTVQVNQWGPLLWTQVAWRHTLQENGGCILNVSSVGGLGVEPGIGYYNATKAALIHLTRQLANELAPGVRVNAIAPGLVRTEFARVLWETAGDQVASRTPLKRIGEPEDMAGAAVFLASDAASWITGHTLVIDGGAMVKSAF